MAVNTGGRSTGDMLVLLIAATICLSVMGSGLTIGIVRIVHPEVDVSQPLGAVTDIINTLIGLLAGYLAGKSGAEKTAAAAPPPPPTVGSTAQVPPWERHDGSA